jgi:hypothetical protein
VSVRSLRDAQIAQRPMTERPITERPITERPITERPAVAAERPVVTTGPTPQAAETEQMEPASGRHVEPETERVAVAQSEKPAHRGFGWFHRNRETTATR